MAFTDLTQAALNVFNCGKNEAADSAAPISLDAAIGTDATTDGVRIPYDSHMTLGVLNTSGAGDVTVRYTTKGSDSEGATKTVSKVVAAGEVLAIPPLSDMYNAEGFIEIGLSTANMGTADLIPVRFLP